jgi:hypothetical protein
MRTVLVILGAVMLLLGPADEHLHDHGLGSTDGHCVACHTDRTPVEPPSLHAPLPLTVTVTPIWLGPARAVLLVSSPLRLAPKTSPPARLA